MKKNYFLLLLVLVFFHSNLVVAGGYSFPANPAIADLNPYQPLNFLDIDRVKSYMQILTSYGTRVTGYKGCDKAASFIFKTLKDFGLNPYYEFFNVTIPVDYGASLKIYSENGVLLRNFTVYPLRPNLVETCTTPPNGTVGKIFYVGKGYLSDFDGYDIEDSIIVMDFDSKSNWINAAKFGAKAVVFLEPEEFSSVDSSQKYVNVPLDFPRVLLRKENSHDLLSLINQNYEVYARLDLKMEFEDKTARNILCFINGTDPQLKSDVIVISAYYDSYSIVPSLAPGAEESVGVSLLLEIARFFSLYPPKRSVLILALSGHNQALAGIRDFINRHFSDITSTDGDTSWRYKLLINLDLSSENNVLGVFYWGYFYAFQKVISRFEIVKRIFNTYIPEFKEKTGKTLNIMNCLLMTLPPGTMYRQYMFDSEPFTMAGGIGVTYATTQTLEIRQGTPSDIMDYVNFSNIRPQCEAAMYTLYALANDENLILPSITPFRYDDRMGGFASLKGQVLEYNYSTGWFTPVPNALVYVQGYPVEPYVCGQDMYGNNLPLYGHEFYVRADSNGEFIIHGVAPRTAYVNLLGDFNYIFEAYLDDPSYGPVDYAPDFGKYASFPKKALIISAVEEVYPVVFKCGTVALYDLLHPSSLLPLNGLFFEINDFSNHFAFDHFGYCVRTYAHIPSPVTMIFVPPDSLTEIIIHSALRVYPTGWLINASKEKPSGSGFRVNAGECIHLNPIHIAIDAYWLNEERIKFLSSHGITLSLNETQHSQNRYNFLGILNSKSENNISASYRYAFLVWAYEFSIYSNIRTTIQDCSNTIVFFSILLIPFSFLLERLLFEHQGSLKRSLSLGFIFVAFLLILGFSHPGFAVSPSAPLILIGFTVTCLIMPPIVLLLWKSWGFIKKFRTIFVGKHFMEISRTSAMLLAFSMGISNMRRRKMRTALAIISLTLITFALVSLSSFSESIVLKKADFFEGKTEYNGLLVRSRSYAPLSSEAVSLINKTINSLNGTLIPRAFLGGHKKLFGFQGRNYIIEGILGLKKEEPINMQQVIKEGNWFTSSDLYQCIIPSEAKDLLNVEVGDQIRLSNIFLRVCGIFDDNKTDKIVDLDQNSIIPFTGEAAGVGGIGGAGRPMESRFLIIVPYEMAVQLGANTYTLAITFQESAVIENALKLLSSGFTELFVCSGINGKISVIQYAKQVFLSIESLIVPFTLVFLSIFNMMLGMVHERTKEINILSSIGLSPLHIVAMFLSQAILYSVISSVLGYTISIVGVNIIKAIGTETIFVPNYSSSMVINSVGLTMLVILTSVVYPFYKASKIVTPSLERKWKMPTKPKGNEWHIPLPFSVEEDFRKGLLCYLKEFLESFPTERVSLFSASEIRYEGKEGEECLEFIARLSPYEAGIKQIVSIRLVLNKSDKKYHINISIRRLEGILSVWKTANRPFVNELRRQLLNWKSLSTNEKKRYQNRWRELYVMKR